MADRPFAADGDPAVAPEPGYYPDPSIPGFVRYWGGAAWVPGTSRPAPAEGEVLVPPRFATRRPGPGLGSGAGPGSGPGPGSGSGLGPGPGPAGPRVAPPPVVPVPQARSHSPMTPSPSPSSSPVPSSSLPPVSERPPSPFAPSPVPAPSSARPSGTSGDTGPVYFDQTTGGASFVVGPRVAEVIGGPVFRTVEAGAEEAQGGSGWQADPREQRGLMETGGSPRWVSWGVLPGAPEAEEGRAEVEHAPVSVEIAAATAPTMSVTVREAPGPTAVAAAVASPTAVAEPIVGAEPIVRAEPIVGAEPIVRAQPGQEPAPDPEAGAEVEIEVEPAARARVAGVAEAEPETAPVPGREAPVPVPRPASAPVPAHVSGAPLPAVRPARTTAVRRRPGSAAPAAAAVPAGLGRRLAARAVDTGVLLVVAVAAGIPLGRSVADHLQQKLDQAKMASFLARREVQVWLVDDVVLGKLAVLLGILLFAGLLYEVLPIARTGQTFGKRLARIRVVDATRPGASRLSLGRSLLRWAVRQVGLVLLLGLVWPVFDRPARRGWQDRAAGTRVVRG
ncbi:RDD family protein [Kitasatospora sp. NPDC048194]|uniref:RDD family protein n=1 Tax=Kitasatospora sp. NPDC048194 TaxID=3364045 RepID=UPI003713D2A3